MAGYHLSLTFDIFLQFEILQNSCAVEHFFLHTIPNGALHHTPGRGGTEEDQLFGLKQALQGWLNAPVEFLKIRATMPDHRSGHGTKRFFAYFHRTWNMQFGMGHNRLDDCCNN